MSWTAITTIGLCGIGLAADVIALIENHRRVGPVAARWEFLAWSLFSASMASTSWDHWNRGEVGEGAVTAVIALALLCVAGGMLRKRRRAAKAAAIFRHDRPDH